MNYQTTPAETWRANGQSDPHGTQYDCERHELTLGTYTDDELANGAFLNYDQPLDVHAVMSKKPGYHPAIAWMTAVKDRIRWLSRKLSATEIDLAAHEALNRIKTENLETLRQQLADAQSDAASWQQQASDRVKDWDSLREQNAKLREALKRCRFDSLNMTFEDMAFVRAALGESNG